jgi:hypothetical protein
VTSGSDRTEDLDAFLPDLLADPHAVIPVPGQAHGLAFDQMQAVGDLVYVAPVEREGEDARQVTLIFVARLRDDVHADGVPVLPEDDVDPLVEPELVRRKALAHGVLGPPRHTIGNEADESASHDPDRGPHRNCEWAAAPLRYTFAPAQRFEEEDVCESEGNPEDRSDEHEHPGAARHGGKRSAKAALDRNDPYVATAAGGGISAVGASFVVGAILSDPPEISPGLLIAGVGAMLLLLAAMAALSLLVLRLRRVRFVADANGLRWDDPYWFSSHALAWEDVIGFERIGRGPVQGLCIRTQDGRCRRLRVYDPTVPAASREVVTTLIGELDSLRRSYARP